MSCGGFNWLVLAAKNCIQAPLFVVPDARNCIQEPLYVVPSANECDGGGQVGNIVPAKPRGLSASNITNTSFTLSWDPNPTATSFTATWGPYIGTIVGNTAQFTGLPALVTYSCLVTAINSNGSVKSDLFAVTTTDVPGNPTNITILRRGTTYFIVRCDTVQYATRYAVFWNSVTFTFNATAGLTQTFNFGSTNPLMAPLTDSTSSTCIIQPTNDAGNGVGTIPISTTAEILNVRLLNVSFPDPFYVSTVSLGTITIPNDFDLQNNPDFFGASVDANGKFLLTIQLSSAVWPNSNGFAVGFNLYGQLVGVPVPLNGNTSLLTTGQFFSRLTQLTWTPNPLTGTNVNWTGWITPGAQLVMLLTGSDGTFDINTQNNGYLWLDITYNSFSAT